MLSWEITTDKVRRKPGGVLEKKRKPRPIAYASHKDAAIYAYYGHLLAGRYEEQLAAGGIVDCVTAFRSGSGRCNIDFAHEAFSWIRARGECVALAFDIKSFFDSLDHEILKRNWCRVLGTERLPDDHFAVFRSLTRFASVDRAKVFRALGISPHNPRANKRRRICSPEDFRSRVRAAGLVQRNEKAFGIPQGSPMSAVLSNIYLLDFDLAVAREIGSVGGLYRRYCDDMLCILPRSSADAVEKFVHARIAEVKLAIQEEKTKRHHFELLGGRLCTREALQYLGFLFDGERVLLRTASVARYYRKMRAGVRLAALTKARHDRLRALKGDKPTPLRRKKLNRRYSYMGRQNFISYALRAAKEMGEKAIRKQVKPHWRKLNDQISKSVAD